MLSWPGVRGERKIEPDEAASPYDVNLQRVVRLTREMLALADEGDQERRDDSCGILYGVLRDAAYRIRKLAQEEIRRHAQEGRED